MELSKEALSDFLNFNYEKFNNPDFIDNDPISIPHRFTKKEDIEISGFLSATIAWGKREMIIKNAIKMMELLDNAPYEFIINHNESDLNSIKNFTHRTFNLIDFKFFIQSLHNIYVNNGGLENVLFFKETDTTSFNAIITFYNIFFDIDHPNRSTKHVSNPAKGSAAKRLNMFLRWMIRKDTKGVDFGIWKKGNPAKLIMPLDIHTGNVSRKLGLLKRKQNDWKAAEELTSNLKQFSNEDPVKYDFALFGLGVNQEI